MVTMHYRVEKIILRREYEFSQTFTIQYFNKILRYKDSKTF